MKINGYTTEGAVRKAVQHDPEKFINILEEAGKKIMTSQFYPKTVKDAFSTACVNVYVDPMNFSILPGSRDLLRFIFDSILSKPLKTKRNLHQSSKNVVELADTDQFTEINKNKLDVLLKRNFRKHKLTPPAVFIMSVDSNTAWFVDCSNPSCGKRLKVFLTNNGINLQFNTANYINHVRNHDQSEKSLNSSSEFGSNSDDTNEVLISTKKQDPKTTIIGNSSNNILNSVGPMCHESDSDQLETSLNSSSEFGSLKCNGMMTPTINHDPKKLKLETLMPTNDHTTANEFSSTKSLVACKNTVSSNIPNTQPKMYVTLNGNFPQNTFKVVKKISH